jgi:NAD(P)-dependent dehydrogenase (short-subunit alcohol dehydrogenase family)
VEYSVKSHDEFIARRIEVSALKRFVDPKYIAAMAAFLWSDDAVARTAEDINVTVGNIIYWLKTN